jgi:hypothetical protein
MGDEEEVVPLEEEDRTDLAEKFAHPKLKEGYVFQAHTTDFIVDESGRDSLVTLRVATYPDTEEAIERVYIEITRENDIYFVANWELLEPNFKEFAQKQHLRKNQTFSQFIRDLLEILQNVTTNRTTFRAIFSGTDPQRKLELKQQLEFKNVPIFCLPFTVVDKADKYVKDQAQFRYQWLSHEIVSQESDLARLMDHIRAQNAPLAQQLEKGTRFAQSLK